MCSVGDDHLNDKEEKYMPLQEANSFVNAKCNKCRENDPVVVLRSKDVYCKDCFLKNTNHKFKAILGKHKLIRPRDKILVHQQIGHPSTALLHFLRTGLNLDTSKKLQCEVFVVYIEDNTQFSVQYRKEILQKIENEVHQFNFPIQFVSFANYLKDKLHLNGIFENHDKLVLSDDDKYSVFECINRKNNKTEEKDILHIYKRNLLLDVAKHLDCKFIFTPDISIDIASQLLSDISLGRGSNVPIDTGFCDNRDEHVKILRPLRTFDIKELAFYNSFNHLSPVSIKRTENDPYRSVQNLIRKFVTDLQVGYPATVTTIMKTGDKLTIDKTNNKSCKLCQGVIMQSSNNLMSVDSTNFSHWVSTQKPENDLTRQEKYEQIINNYKKIEDIDYCYSCNKLSGLLNT